MFKKNNSKIHDGNSNSSLITVDSKKTFWRKIIEKLKDILKIN